MKQQIQTDIEKVPKKTQRIILKRNRLTLETFAADCIQNEIFRSERGKFLAFQVAQLNAARAQYALALNQTAVKFQSQAIYFTYLSCGPDSIVSAVQLFKMAEIQLGDFAEEVTDSSQQNSLSNSMQSSQQLSTKPKSGL